MQPGARPRAALLFAWMGGALFVVSLLYGFGVYLTVMGRPTTAQAGLAAPLLLNALLFSAFALHHSVFARDRVRAWVQGAVPARLERSLYVWIASILLMVVCAVWRPVPGVAWRAGGGGTWLLRALQLAGVWLTVRSAALLDPLELAGIRQVTAAGDGMASDFKAAGPYGWVRHPIYSGWFLMIFAEPVMTATRLSFAMLSGVYLLAAIPFEERSLRRAAGIAYERYLRQVRWRLIPGVY